MTPTDQSELDALVETLRPLDSASAEEKATFEAVLNSWRASVSTGNQTKAEALSALVTNLDRVSKARAAANAAEMKLLRLQQCCPCCGSKQFFKGTKKGPYLNVCCARCASKFLVSPDLSPEWAPFIDEARDQTFRYDKPQSLAEIFKDSQEELRESSAELDKLNEGVCPDCKGTLFNKGPTGGLSHNIRCAECGSKFCLSPPFTPTRIENPDRVYHLAHKTSFEKIVWS